MISSFGGKSKGKKYLGYNVLAGAEKRIAMTFELFPRIYVSFSGGKDSTVMLHLCANEAYRRGRKFGLLFIDWECQYKLTIDHVTEMVNMYWTASTFSGAAFYAHGQRGVFEPEHRRNRQGVDQENRTSPLKTAIISVLPVPDDF